jgi:hypothetical protein
VVARCDCGTERVLTEQSLLSGHTGSCGCLCQEKLLASRTKHGLRHHPLYATWRGMMQRCYDPDWKQFKDYGGRGIKVCDRWHDVRLFIEDIERDLGPRPDGMTLDRADNDSGYGPGKVRWATRVQQVANRRLPEPWEA